MVFGKEKSTKQVSITIIRSNQHLGFPRFSRQVLSIFFCLYSPRTLYILENILEYTNTSKLHEPHGGAGGAGGTQREEQHGVEAERSEAEAKRCAKRCAKRQDGNPEESYCGYGTFVKLMRGCHF